MEIHPHLGAASCLHFEGQTGTVKNQPDAKELETKAQLERGKRSVKWDSKGRSIWRGLGLTNQRVGPSVGSGGGAKLLGKEWDAQGKVARAGREIVTRRLLSKMGRWLNKQKNQQHGAQNLLCARDKFSVSSNSVFLSSFPEEPALSTHDGSTNFQQDFPLTLMYSLSDSHLLMKLFS